MVQKRGPAGSPKWFSVGPSTDVTVEEARRQAAEIIDRLKRGEEAFPEPPASEPTVADLAERYMTAHVEVNCRAGTVETFGRVVRLYILPELGHMRLSEVERSHVAALHRRMRDKPYQANQARNVLAKMFRLAEAWGMMPSRRNPCLSIRRYKGYRRERFLSQEEYQRLARVLDEAQADGSVFPTAVPAIRLLLLTGCRKREILHLRWEQVDLEAGELRLPDTKTGPRTVLLSPTAVRVLERIPRLGGSPWVIPGKVEGRPMRNIDETWWAVCKVAGLKDIRIHDCRHSFASRALALGVSLPMIGCRASGARWRAGWWTRWRAACARPVPDKGQFRLDAFLCDIGRRERTRIHIQSQETRPQEQHCREIRPEQGKGQPRNPPLRTSLHRGEGS